MYVKTMGFPHLPVLNNVLGLCTGRSEQGVLREVREYYSEHAGGVYWDTKRWWGPIDAVFASPSPRAIETVNIRFRDLNVPVVVDERLHAIDYGELHNTPMAEMQQLITTWIAEQFPGGESFEQMAERHRSFVHDLLPRYYGKTVLVILHNATFQILLHVCSAIPLRQALSRGFLEETFRPAGHQGRGFSRQVKLVMY